MPKNEINDPITDQAVDGPHPLTPDREQVLARLWEIGNLPPDMTRGSITGQVKALSMIVAMLNLVPDRRPVSSENKSAPAPAKAQIYKSEWLRRQQAATIYPQPAPAPSSAEEVAPDSGQSTFVNRASSSEAPPPAPSVPDTRLPFSMKKNTLVHPR